MVTQSVEDIVARHVKLSVECIDRMYLNVHVPRLQTEQGVAGFPLSSATAVGGAVSPISRGFVAALEAFAAKRGCRSSSLARDGRTNTGRLERSLRLSLGKIRCS